MSEVSISRELLAYMMDKLQMVGPDAEYLRAAQEAYYRPAPVQVPEGWKLVPVEPTVEMLESIANTVPCMTSDARLAYPAMLAAAPSAHATPALAADKEQTK